MKAPPGPAISVIIPTYDRAGKLPAALESVLDQTEARDEVIVVDDGSTDGTGEVVAGFGDSIRYLRIPHGGAGAARNAGVGEAGHEWIAFLDSDDVWLPGKLAVQRAAVAAFPEAVLCFAEYEGRDPQGGTRPARMRAGGWRPERLGPPRSFRAGAETHVAHLGDGRLMLFETGPLIQINTVLARRAALLRCPFPTDVAIYEEDQVFACVASRGPLLYVDEVVAVLAEHGGPRLTDALGSLEAEAAWLKIVERTWGRDPVFLERNGGAYREILGRMRHDHVRSLLVRGMRKEALEEMRKLPSTPPVLRALAALPDGLLRWLLGVRRALRA